MNQLINTNNNSNDQINKKDEEIKKIYYFYTIY